MKQNLLMMAFFLLWPFYAVADYATGFYANNRGDYATAYKEWKPLAVQGYASSQAALGLLYKHGHGVQQNYKTAVKWFRKAAAQGLAEAQHSLGLFYQNGYGVQQNYKTAVKWYRKAAAQGFAISQTGLGISYDNGYGVQQDYKTAAKWYRMAAEQGEAYAQNNLGSFYEIGLGVPRNYVQAYKWYNLAVADGYEDAQGALDKVAKSMTTSQIAEAQKLSNSFRSEKRPSGTKSDSSYAAVDRSMVRDIQSHLKALGYDPGPPDGVPGKLTVTAVKAFQREWDIQPDGVLSSTLLKVLKITLEANSKSDHPVSKEISLAGSGSGFTVGGDYVVTNHHVVDNCSKLVVYMNGNPVSGSVAASSDNDDLALIKLAKRSSYQASFRDSGRARLGEDIWVVGYPLRTLLASGLNVVSGEISALAGLGNNTRVMQISAPVQLGNSGGPLLDKSGNVVGVVVSKLDAKKFADAIGDIPQNINFAIKGTVVKSFLDTHGIDYQTASSSSWAWTKNKNNGEEIAAKAREFTVPVECYK